MAFVPHTPSDREAMLQAIGLTNIDDLFADVPEDKRFPTMDLPAPLSESEVLREVSKLASKNASLDKYACFLGAGAYNHYIPSVVKHMLLRGEFYTSYTPYQPEVSQGTLQAIFEYQTMICALTGMDAANASHYDGATALAESFVMAASTFRGRRSTMIVSRSIHPQYRLTARTYLQGVEMKLIGDDEDRDLAGLAELIDEDTAAVAIQVPDFLGEVPSRKEIDALSEACKAAGALFVVVANPISLGLLEAPGSYGADVVLGEGQPLGNTLSYGGPYLGYFATKREHLRRMAGRLAGMTVDADGNRGFVLTLSTREQHIRRERATSNICTNQALNALAATVYLTAMGPEGLKEVAGQCYHKAHYAAKRIGELPGYAVRSQSFFHEFVVQCPVPIERVSQALLDAEIIPGYPLCDDYPELKECMLFCTTELNTREEIDRLVEVLGELS